MDKILQALPGHHNNGVMNHMERFKKLGSLTGNLDWIEKNSSKKFKLGFEQIDMVYLNNTELESIKNEVLFKPA